MNEPNLILKNLYDSRGNNTGSLSILFEYTEICLKENRLFELNYLLINIDIEKVDRIIYTGLLRCTFRVKYKLDYWKCLLAKVEKHLNKNSEDAKHILRGLV